MIVAEGSVLDIDPSWLSPLHAAEIGGPRAPCAIRKNKRFLTPSNVAAARSTAPTAPRPASDLKPTTLYGKMKKHGIRSPKNDAK